MFSLDQGSWEEKTEDRIIYLLSLMILRHLLLRMTNRSIESMEDCSLRECVCMLIYIYIHVVLAHIPTVFSFTQLTTNLCLFPAFFSQQRKAESSRRFADVTKISTSISSISSFVRLCVIEEQTVRTACHGSLPPCYCHL